MEDISTMEQIVVKTEVQPNGDILLFYVDENQAHDENVENTYGIIQQSEIEGPQESKYVIEAEAAEDSGDDLDLSANTELLGKEKWLPEETKRLLIFYLDNKETFLNGTTRKKHLWAVACRTMLTDKTPISCEVKLRNLKRNYTQMILEAQKGTSMQWPFYDLCQQAFHDDSFVKCCLNENPIDRPVITVPIENSVPPNNESGILMVKKVNSRTTVDDKVELMLNLYLKYKDIFLKNYSQRSAIWETIAMEMGEEEAEYWHKRFLNFRQHYIRMMCKRQESGSDSINWPYMKWFDQIYGEDEEFQKKYCPKSGTANGGDLFIKNDNVWNTTETTFLAKYYFDCLHEFEDPTIPDKFLWQEVGRYLDRRPDSCQTKFEELKAEHFNKLTQGYHLPDRVPIEIIFDSIISKQTETELSKLSSKYHYHEPWASEVVDELVNYLYDNIGMLKDSVCYYVCWAALSKKLQKDVLSCRKEWEDLTNLYKSILNEKKEDPDLQIDWRYIDLFDRIFDYGMDTNLLQGYEKLKEEDEKRTTKIGVKKVTINESENKYNIIGTDDEECYDERGFTKRVRSAKGDSKAFKILEFYLKNKEKFATRKKLSVWEIIAKQIGLTATECAHRFRNLKQVYMTYIQREISKPEMPIIWPYYALCKKVFGYRAVKSKLKNSKMEAHDADDWTAKEIKQLINYFSTNYDSLYSNTEDSVKWLPLASELGRTDSNCCEKFLELRKSFRKLKTMKTRNPDVKVSWKYFSMLDNIYSRQPPPKIEAIEPMEYGDVSEYDELEVKEEGQDDDYQCIIVLPEGQDLSDLSNAQVIIQSKSSENVDQVIDEVTVECVPETKPRKWNRRIKKQLLIHYLNYVKACKDREINSKDMWYEIALKLGAFKPVTCRRVFLKMKKEYKELPIDHLVSPYQKLFEKILKIKPKFARLNINKSTQERTYKDVVLPDDKVEQALRYYLEHLEEFTSPKFEKKYLWTEVAKFISEPVSKVFNKINYLKQMYSSEAFDSNVTPFSELLMEILVRENTLKDMVEKDQQAISQEGTEEPWTDDEVEKLLTWYLAHLDKFKNPKFVRCYLWMEAADILKKSPIECSKKMSEIRTQYRTMVKETPEVLENWRFYGLCQRIYGTGKKQPQISLEN